MFAIEKKFFLELGSYDDQMTRWGGENVDLGFRVNIPCENYCVKLRPLELDLN